MGGGDLAVTANGTPNMSVNVAAGEIWIPGSITTRQGLYYGLNDASVNLTITPSDPTNPRNDLVVATVQDAQYAGATNTWLLQVIAGTPAGTPLDPTVPANSYKLARVVVAANAASIVSGNITDLRSAIVPAGSGV
ncbi:MAG: hypothetical protein ACYDAD_14855, partial [Acidimicrobiales bacterium]